MDFDLSSISLATLYGFFEDKNSSNPRHIQIPIASDVQSELMAILNATTQKLGIPSVRNLPIFDPAEKYQSEEKLQLPLSTDYMKDLAFIVSLTNLPSDPQALSMIDELEYYYAVFVDKQGRTLHAFRRASQFKGIARSKIVLMSGGTLKLLSKPVFRLDLEFDYLVTATTIYILRPSGFEFTTNVRGQIQQAAASNAQSIGVALPYLEIAGIAQYAGTHARSARLLAAIRARGDLDKVERKLLAKACKNYGIDIANPPKGKLAPKSGYEYDFLCILDRRAYTADLVANQSEKYEAASRVRR